MARRRKPRNHHRDHPGEGNELEKMERTSGKYCGVLIVAVVVSEEVDGSKKGPVGSIFASAAE